MIDNFSIFPKTLPRDQNSREEKDELIILDSPLGPKSHADLLEKKTNELEKVNRIDEKLDAHFCFFYVEKLLQFAKVVVLPENQYMF